MKTFSLMSNPDLILTKDAYLRLILKTKSEIELITSKMKVPDENLAKLQKKLLRLRELHEAVCMEFPKITLSEFHKWNEQK